MKLDYIKSVRENFDRARDIWRKNCKTNGEQECKSGDCRITSSRVPVSAYLENKENITIDSCKIGSAPSSRTLDITRIDDFEPTEVITT